MSEKSPKNNHEQLNKNKIEHVISNKNEKLSSHEINHGKHEHVDAKRKEAEAHALHAEKHAPVDKETGPSQHPALVRKDLKELELGRTLTRIRKRLSAPSRVFSKVIHNPVIDETSEVLGKTVARPSGFLWGSLIAFIGTSALLWITRHYGYEYNYLAIMLLFGFGLILGNIGELAWRSIRRK